MIFFKVAVVLYVARIQMCGIQLVTGVSFEENGPQIIEPLTRSVLLTSRDGGKVQCKADGQPKPMIQWLTKDFHPVTNISSIREINPDGTLHFFPFSPDQFRSDVHNSLYRCRAFNPVGVTISHEIHVRAVVDVPYEIENRDVSVLRGNIAILRCIVPLQLRDFVTITSWQQDSTLNIYPNFQTGKYLLLPNGDLYVFNVEPADTYKRYACRTSNRVTNEIKVSPSSRIVVKDSDGPEAVKLLVPKQVTIKANSGDDVHLPCLASGIPPPTYLWFQEKEDEILESYVPGTGSNTKARDSFHEGPILLTHVQPEDAGKRYVCSVNNSISHDTTRIQLNVYVPLHIQLNPKSHIIEVGRSMTFRCLISGSPVDSVEWFKDGKRVGGSPTSRWSLSGSRLELTITSVEPDDAGMFQCFGTNDQASAQDSAQLRLGSIVPELVYRFTEQTLQPGPSVSLKCTGVGNPPPQFQWTLDGFPLPESERYLVGQYVTIHDNVISHVNISNVESFDGGLYTCLAHNNMGVITHSARLNIYGPPFIRPIPPVKAVAGKQFSIQCPVSGFPIESITWERGGTSLPVNRRQKAYPNGTLIIEQIQQGEDEGIYGCEAKNRQGLTSTRDLHVQVIVAPKIMPFQFMSQLLGEGKRASVSCSVIEGDRPFEFTWLFDEKPISVYNHQGPRITFPDEYSSTLVIETLSSAHTGLYTCIAQNSAGREHHAAMLTVNVPPKWTLEPRDINVSAGHSIALHCQADGYPTPSILWKRATGSQPGEYKDLTGSWTGIYVNGTIRFDEVRKLDEGQYLCEARNGVGSGLSKVIYVRVNAPAQFLERDQQISVRVGGRAILQCRAKGDLPIEIQWSNKHNKISPHSNHRYTNRQQDLEDGVMSEMLIGDVNREDGGVYSCRAANMFGTDQTTVILSVQEPPGQPMHIRVVDQKSRSIRVSWIESFNGNSPLINFIIQYKFPSETWTEAEVEEVAVPATQTSSRVDGLSPATTYHIRVLASNSMGYSPPSELVQMTTAEEAPEGSPEDIRIEPVGSTQLRVKWSSPPKHLWHGNLLGYYIGYKELSLAFNELGPDFTTPHYGLNSISSMDANGFHFKTVDVGIDFGGTSVLDGLNKFTRYAIVVQAFNSQGPGPPSSPVIGVTIADVPSMPPAALVCTPTSSTSLQLTWDDPPLEGRHGVTNGYKIKYHREDTVDQADVDVKMSAVKSTTLHGLKRWTNYSLAVLASTVAGDGVYSKPLICSTDEDVPSPPAGIKVLPSSRRSILVAWIPPESPNGRIERYTLYTKALDSSKTEKKNLLPHETSFGAIGLKENQQYEFWVTVFTKMGESGSTPRVRAATASKVPAKIASFGNLIEVEWKKSLELPCESVGIPESTVVWKLNGAHIELGTRHHVNGVGTLTVDGISTADQGNYTCSISNPYGSDMITYNVKIQNPPPPPSTQVMDTFYEAIHISWTIVSNGGSAIKGFVIHYKAEDGDWEEVEAEAGSNNHILKGLGCGSKYQLYVTAANKIGTGLPSQIVQAHTKGNVPVIPKKGDVLSGNSSSITIRLGTWTEPECPIQRVSIDYKGTTVGSSATPDTNWIHVPNELNLKTITSYTIHGLEAGVKYYVRISAENNAGRSTVTYDFVTPPSTLAGVKWTGNGELDETDVPPLYTSFLIVFPSVLALLAVSGVIVVMCYFRRKRVGYGPKTVIGDSPGGMNTYADNQMPGGIITGRNREARYCPVKTTDPSSSGDGEDLRYKTCDSADYGGEDVCPYATFQLPEKAPGRPLLNKGEKKFGYHTGDTMYNVGNVYSGPYHSLESCGFHYNQAPTMPMREPDYMKGKRRHEFENPDSDNLASTDSEVKKILSLHMPIVRDYDTLGSDSEGDKFHQRSSSPPHHHQLPRINHQQYPGLRNSSGLTLQQQHELITFRQKQRSDPVITSEQSSTSSDTSPGGTTPPRKSSYLSRKHNKSKSSVQSGSSAKLRVRSSSGYSSHTEETSFSFGEKIQPPTRFSDSHDLSDGVQLEYGSEDEPVTSPSTLNTKKSQKRSRKAGKGKRYGTSTLHGGSSISQRSRGQPAYHIDV